MIDKSTGCTSVQNQLLKISAGYLHNILDNKALSELTTAYKSLLKSLYTEELDVEEGRSDIAFSNGMAIGAYWAAFCLDDHKRTRSFIRGIDQAIQNQLKERQQLNIMYAGTGPYATLLLPLMLKYAQHDIKYTFIEINNFSISILKEIISNAGMQDYNITYVQEDASTYQIAQENQPDIIISETMQKALEKEQQVPIFLNLMNQSKEDTIFIPEKVELSIGLVNIGFNIEQQTAKDFRKVATVFEMSKESLLPGSQWVDAQTGKTSFKKILTKIDQKQLKDVRYLFLMTEIQTYGNERIIVNESGLTMPTYMLELQEGDRCGMVITSQYQVSKFPTLDYSIHFTKSLKSTR